MGNIPSSNNYSERFPLDGSSEVVLRKTKSCKWRDVVDTRSAEYYSFGRTSCELNLTKTNRNKHEEELSISIHDHASDHANDYVHFQMDMTVGENLLLGKVIVNGPRSMLRLPECKTPIAQGGVLKSSSFLYGNDTDRKGLIVMSWARRCDDDEVLPYMITVQHYFVAAWCSHGVSVVAKILSGTGDGRWSVQLEKPSTQPKRSLLSMFDDVKGKGWRPNPGSSDCAIEISNQNKNPANANLSYNISGQQSISSLISNGGSVNGNGNGSIICHQNYYISGRHNI